MKLILIAGFLLFLAAWALWHSSVRRLWRSLGAQPVGHYPVWRQVRERLEVLARQERKPKPELWILPEFSPNAMVLRGGGVKIALSEGLLRILEDEELEAVLRWLLLRGSTRRRRILTLMALQLHPFAQMLQGYPVLVQVVLAPWLTILLRLVARPETTYQLDQKVGQSQSFALAKALQKIAVTGKKIPFRHWNFALDPLFLVSPLVLDANPFWVFLTQPSVEERRRALLSSHASS